MSVYSQRDTNGYTNRFKKRESSLKSRKFKRSEAYTENYITKDGYITTDKYPLHIFVTKPDDTRKFVCHPDYNINRGAIINDYDGFDYLVSEHDRHVNIEDFGTLLKMSQSITWEDKYGNNHSIKYHTTKTGSGSQDSNYIIPLSETKKQIWVQFNSESKELFKNQRFILGNLEPYKITARDNFSSTGILKLTMESTQRLDGDNLETGIAINKYSDSSQDTSDKTGVYFSEPLLEVPTGLSKTVEVYEYNDGIPTSSAFIYRIDGIDTSHYTITSQTDNSITITADEFYYQGTLVAIRVIDSFETSIPLVLKSMI